MSRFINLKGNGNLTEKKATMKKKHNENCSRARKVQNFHKLLISKHQKVEAFFIGLKITECPKAWARGRRRPYLQDRG